VALNIRIDFGDISSAHGLVGAVLVY
jgi:hypothetical protein